jgi:PBP1b-binding outer membrane lipoprotein LpoB
VRVQRLGLLLTLVALLAGCGGDDDSGELSRDEYTKQANAICVEVEKKLDALGGFEDFDELAREMKEGEDALRTSVDELRALQPPVELRGQHAKLVDLQSETADVAERIAAAAADNDQVEMQKQAERADKLTIASNETARKLKLAECVAG